MADSFTDHRGTIENLLVTPLDSVTRIFTKAGAVRGNHVHKRTYQWAYVVSGELLTRASSPDGTIQVSAKALPGEMVLDEPGWAHAWKAAEDTVVLVFTRGPRSGDNYEQDTERLAGSLFDDDYFDSLAG